MHIHKINVLQFCYDVQVMSFEEGELISQKKYAVSRIPIRTLTVKTVDTSLHAPYET